MKSIDEYNYSDIKSEDNNVFVEFKKNYQNALNISNPNLNSICTGVVYILGYLDAYELKKRSLMEEYDQILLYHRKVYNYRALEISGWLKYCEFYNQLVCCNYDR